MRQFQNLSYSIQRQFLGISWTRFLSQYSSNLSCSMLVVIGILLQSTSRCNRVKQHWLVLGWMTVLVCQFLLIVLRMRLWSEVPWHCSCSNNMNFPLGLKKVHFSIFFFHNDQSISRSTFSGGQLKLEFQQPHLFSNAAKLWTKIEFKTINFQHVQTLFFTFSRLDL